jgi:hypothetical protein
MEELTNLTATGKMPSAPDVVFILVMFAFSTNSLTLKLSNNFKQVRLN